MFFRRLRKMDTKIEDLELWIGLKGGSREFFAALYSRYFSSLLAYGLRIRQAHDLACDAVQNTLVKLWNNREAQ